MNTAALNALKEHKPKTFRALQTHAGNHPHHGSASAPTDRAGWPEAWVPFPYSHTTSLVSLTLWPLFTSQTPQNPTPLHEIVTMRHTKVRHRAGIRRSSALHPALCSPFAHTQDLCELHPKGPTAACRVNSWMLSYEEPLQLQSSHYTAYIIVSPEL